MDCFLAVKTAKAHAFVNIACKMQWLHAAKHHSQMGFHTLLNFLAGNHCHCHLPFTDLQKEYERAGIRIEVILAIQQVIQGTHAGCSFQQCGLHSVRKAKGWQIWTSLRFRRVAVQHLHHLSGQAAKTSMAGCLSAGDSEYTVPIAGLATCVEAH